MCCHEMMKSDLSHHVILVYSTNVVSDMTFGSLAEDEFPVLEFEGGSLTRGGAASYETEPQPKPRCLIRGMSVCGKHA